MKMKHWKIIKIVKIKTKTERKDNIKKIGS